MLKCTRCGRYYVPGYLDCLCRSTARSSRLPVASLPALKDQSTPSVLDMAKSAQAATAASQPAGKAGAEARRRS